jgi:Na+:H+ antiporter
MAAVELTPIVEELFLHHSSTLNLLMVMVVIWSTGVVCRWIKQPALLGELLAGIVLGPALFGVIQPDETLKVLAELGVFFLMFYAGLESNPGQLEKYKKQAAQVGLGGYLVPFVMGYLASRFFGLSLIQSLFIGQALSITAIAVSARILHDLDLTGLRISPVVMGAGIIDDIIALTVFTTLVDMTINHNSLQFLPTLFSLIKVAVFFLVSAILGMWVFPRISSYLVAREAKGFSFALIVALFFGFWAEVAGMHFIIGAYVAGLLVRRTVKSKELFTKINDRFVSITYGFLGPIFFFCLSFHVNFKALQTHMVMATVLLLVAIIGKFIGAYLGGLWAKMNRAEATVIGFAMNGRGAVELIIASVGLEVGLINDDLFSILVFIAFITTLLPPLTLKFVVDRVAEKLIRTTDEK